jgi:MFS superfamily sulfate permease-like transporter
LSAAALQPLVATGAEGYRAYVAMLAILVGVFQLARGLLRLGVLVDFLSHPVAVGSTEGAAIIIATSQLSKLFGVKVESGAHHGVVAVDEGSRCAAGVRARQKAD